MSGSTFNPNKYKNKNKAPSNNNTDLDHTNTGKTKYKSKKLLTRKSIMDFDAEDRLWRNTKTTY